MREVLSVERNILILFIITVLKKGNVIFSATRKNIESCMTKKKFCALLKNTYYTYNVNCNMTEKIIDIR